MRPARFGKYLLIESISRGGMAEVYLGKLASGDKSPVAIKRILPLIAEDTDFQTMFVDEARISACLNHDNIGKVFEFAQHDREYFIAMEYVASQDVRAIRRRLVTRKERMDVGMALCICRQLCRALDHAHRQTTADDISMEIVHRDVSPPNVLVSYDGQVKLIDFGIAWAASRLTRTRAGKLKGKFAYMSPEQVEGSLLDRRSDIFSCGTMLFEMLTQRRPFHGDNEIAIMHAIRKGECPPPSTINNDVPLAVDRIVAKALARERDERYQWASELEADIEAYFQRVNRQYGKPELRAWMREAFNEEVGEELAKQERLLALSAEDCVDALDMEPLEEHHPAHELAVTPPSDTDADVLGRAESGTFGDTPKESDTHDTAAEANSVGARSRSGTDTDADGLAPAVSSTMAQPVDVPPPVLISPHLAANLGGPITGPMCQEAEDELPGDRTQISDAPEHMQATSSNPPLDSPVVPRSKPIYPTPVELESPGPRSQPIYPEGDTIVGGSLEVDADEHQPPKDTSSPRVMGPLAQNYGVSLEPSGPQQVIHGKHHASARPALASTEQTGTITSLSIRIREAFAGMSSFQVTLIAALATLLVVALAVTLVSSVKGGGAEVDEPVGSVLITTTEPAGCTVMIDGLPQGLLTPSNTFKLHGLAVGRHLVLLKCAGYATYSSMVSVKAHDVTVVDAPLEKKRD
ncbi:MAG: serine/threonine protein kinase [Deltaproteobacteria bacterium]|nr:serine/threonine protein kinase [Deltaproteobacteria bacterium]